MSNDAGEKHFDATPSRIAKAKREGNTARATEFGANLAFMAAVLSLPLVVTRIASVAGDAIVVAAHGVPPVRMFVTIVGWGLTPMAAALVVGAGATLVQNGGLLAVGIAPKFERLDPFAGVKRLLSRETGTRALRAVSAFALSAAVLFPILREVFVTAASGRGLTAVAGAVWFSVQREMWSAGAIGLGCALVEYGIARRDWLRKLRMSFEEFKRDAKEHDGDPIARGRRKALHRSFVRASMTNLKRAAFVVVNPTHVAIALEYRPPEVAVPAVLVRAADDLALRVRELSGEYRIPIVENVGLARALYRDSQAGQPIPHAQYVAVAEVVASLLRSGAI